MRAGSPSSLPDPAIVEIVPAQRPEEVFLAANLFCEYAEQLGIDLSFQRFEDELAALPGAYAPPRGRLLLGLVAGQAAGCVGLRPLEGSLCEMKRLYVRPALRRTGVGRRLAEAVIAAGRELGYERMRLDTLPSMDAAGMLYDSLGFTEI